jgi:hypothetical protein
MKSKRHRSLVTAGAGFALLLAAALVGFAGDGTAASQAAPSNQQRPTLTGTPEVGQQLTANAGTWSGTQPISYVYRFQRCDRNGANCYTGGSTTQRTYLVTSDDAGKTVRVRVTATNRDGSTSASSAPTPVIGGSAPPPSGACTGNAPLQVSRISLPERLQLDVAVLEPPVVGRSTQTLTLRVHVACRGRAVQGALVKAEAVPFNQFSSPAESTTGTDGFATITMGQLQGFPAAQRQELLVFFLRARKAGEDPLGGISTRRLVSFPVNLSR